MKKIIKNVVLLVLFVAITFGCMVVANNIQTDNGKVEITDGYISGESLGTKAENVYYRLYKPDTATAATPAPAVLMLHGYQNDNQTCAAYAIEFARRGYVVMAIDEYGHGKTETGLTQRGYVNLKVSVNFGQDSEADGTYKEISGQNRYKIMMNFSNLSFFNDRYTKDSEGNTISDSSCGGVLAYGALSQLAYVDKTNLCVTGHSMGTWSSWTVAAAYANTDIAPKATILQCGELFTDKAYDSSRYSFNNVMLLQAKWDEFSYFRDYQNVVNDEVLHSDIRSEFLGVDKNSCAWNTTFGNFADGSARRIQLLYTNHRLTTHNGTGLEAAIDWFDGATGHKSTISSDNQVAMTKEVLVLIAMFAAIAAMIPLMELLLLTPLFKKLTQPLPAIETIKTNGQWWKGAAITMLLAAATYPFCTQLGHGLFPLPEKIFRMTIGDGFFVWYLILIIIMLAITIVGNTKLKKKGGVVDYNAMGLATKDAPGRISPSLIWRGALLAAIMLLFMYALVCIYDGVFGLDFRFIWPFFRPFTPERAGQFGIYIPMFALFFILNNSKIMASSRCQGTYEPGFKGFIKNWWRNALMMVGGILILVLLEYIPFFANIGPGADLLFGSTFGGPFMSLMIVFVPQVLVFSVLCTYIYRRTGNIYTGAFLVASMACWIVTGGSAML